MTKRKDIQNEILAEIAIDPDVLAQELSVELEIDPLEQIDKDGFSRGTLNKNLECDEALKKLNHSITPFEILKQRKAFRSPAIIRNVYSEVLNILQATVMMKLTKKNNNKINNDYLNDALMTSIAGISAAIKNTG